MLVFNPEKGVNTPLHGVFFHPVVTFEHGGNVKLCVPLLVRNDVYIRITPDIQDFSVQRVMLIHFQASESVKKKI